MYYTIVNISGDSGAIEREAKYLSDRPRICV